LRVQHFSMGNSATLEQEVKFDAPIGLVLPDLRSLVGRTVRLPEEHLATRYFDTADRRLWHEGLTLRHRRTTDDTDGIWTLKLPHSDGGRVLSRTELSWPSAVTDVPADVRALVRGVIRREPLRELVELETDRQRLVLRGENDEVVAELDDDLVHVVGGHRDGEQFRQVELEFLDDEWKGTEVLRRLEGAGARVQNDAKVARALDLPRDLPPSPPLDRASTWSDIVHSSLSAGLARLVAHDWRLRVAGRDPAAEDVHQARVATRRLRSDLKTFGAVLDPVWVRHVRTDLKWLGDALGDVRDTDVLGDALVDAPQVIHDRVAIQRAAADQGLMDVLRSERYVDLLDKLHAGSERIPLAAGAEHEARWPARKVVPSLVAVRWRALRREVRRAGSRPSAAKLHRIRIKSKQLRYAAEMAVPVVGKPAKRTAAAAERIQTVLGEHHDAVAAEAWLRDGWGLDSSKPTSAVTTPAAAFAAGLLAADARNREQASRRRWTREWKRLSDPARRRWLP
jgi:CHAD domain-containing protein